MELIFRKVSISDFYKISLLHLQAFPDFFLSSLGVKFLNTYYKSCFKDSECIAYCATDKENQIVGFIVGALVSHGFHKRVLLKNIVSFFIVLFLAFLTNPSNILRLFLNLNKNKSVDNLFDFSEILSIGVSPFHLRLGIGKKLLLLFENEVFERGKRIIFLTTDVLNNDKVVSFYFTSGYLPKSEFVSYPNRKMYILEKTL